MDLISIIVPVYNLQKYISRCLDSILAQSYRNFEIICVDDGSTDESGAICDLYQNKDSRVKVFHIENCGVSNARNFAISQITGDWFAFVDGDDWIEPNYLEILLQNAIKNECDVSACTYQISREYSLGHGIMNPKFYLFHSSKECIHNCICDDVSLEGLLWNKIYRTKIFKDITFDTNIKLHEDSLYTYRIMEKCEKACLITVPLYHWFVRSGSASRSKTLSKDFGPANVFKDLYYKSLGLADANVSRQLKKNYVEKVIMILTYARYKNNDEDVLLAKNQCRVWKRDVWSLMRTKEKMRYYLAMDMAWLIRFLDLYVLENCKWICGDRK